MAVHCPEEGGHGKYTPKTFPNTSLLSAVYGYIPYGIYRTQVNLGSDLWVRMSVRPSQTDVCKT